MTETALPKLRVSREEARQKIQERIERGEQLRDRRIESDSEFTKAYLQSNNWSEYNTSLLIQLFDNPALGKYISFDYGSPSDDYLPFEPGDVEGYQTDMESSITSLKGIYERLELYDEFLNTPQSTLGNEVFIVHGHDDEAKETVARFVENLGIEATILHEQANRGQTIPEKFEEHASEAGFAIILLTPDDVGASKDERDKLKPRARQNVVLELGYFWGRLGRGRVCVLHKGGVELPSDMQGLLYVPMNSPNEWQLPLATEMKQAGLPIDLNKLA